MAKAHIIKNLCSKLGISISAFERSIGASNASIASAIKRDSEISTDLISKISKAYPNVSSQWLLTGDGEMFTPTPLSLRQLFEVHNLSEDDFSTFTGIPKKRITGWLKSDDTLPGNAQDAQAFRVAERFVSKMTPEQAKEAIRTHRLFMGNVVTEAEYEMQMAQGQPVSEPVGALQRMVSKPVSEAKSLIPYFDVDIIAGMAHLFDDTPTSTPAYYLDIPEFYGCKAFPVYSNSMYPLIPSGSTVFCRQVYNWAEFLEYGQIYAIQLSDSRRFIKYIRRSQKPEAYILRSHNTAEYDDVELPLRMISHVWLVEGYMTKKTQ